MDINKNNKFQNPNMLNGLGYLPQHQNEITNLDNKKNIYKSQNNSIELSDLNPFGKLSNAIDFSKNKDESKSPSSSNQMFDFSNGIQSIQSDSGLGFSLNNNKKENDSMFMI